MLDTAKSKLSLKRYKELGKNLEEIQMKHCEERITE